MIVNVPLQTIELNCNQWKQLKLMEITKSLSLNVLTENICLEHLVKLEQRGVFFLFRRKNFEEIKRNKKNKRLNYIGQSVG